MPSPQPIVRHTAAERLERLPASRYQRMLFIVVALAFLFDSMDLATMTFVLGSIRHEFNLSTAQAGLLASTSFLGMVVGAAASGMLADRFGRKPVFQWSIVIWGVASYLCSTASSAETLGIYRLLLGFGMGMEFPIAQAVLSELVPARARGRYVALMDGFWPIGFVSAGVLSYVMLPLGGWRSVFVALAVPAVFVLAVRRLVPESPRWLEHAGRLDEADRVLEGIEAKVMKSLNVTSLPAPHRLPTDPSVSVRQGPFRTLWSSAYRRRTAMVWSLWFFALLGFYGLSTWLGALMQQAGYAVTKSVLYTVVISLAGIPGFLMSAWLVERWGRKPTCIASLLGSGAMAYAYGHAAAASAGIELVIGFGLAMQFFLFAMWAVLYAYTPELYPTGARATGSGWASAIGRVGSLLGPYIVGVILPYAGQAGVFSLGALSFALAAGVVFVWGVETRGLSLEELSEGATAQGGALPGVEVAD